MVSAGDFKKGVTFEMDGSTFTIIEFQHVKPGKGAAFVRTKIKNVVSGAVVRNHSTRQNDIPKRRLKQEKCSTCMKMGDYTISWTVKPMNRSQ